MRIGIRLAISGLVLASIMVSAIGVHVLWWRTAEANSHALAETINEQIVSAVEKELTTITTEARAAHTAIRTLFVQHVLETREADKREFVFLSQLQSQPNISWVAFGWPDGAFFAAHKLGDLGLEMMEIAPVDGTIKRRIDQYGLWSETSNSRNADSKIPITSSPIRNGTGAECKPTNRAGSMYCFTRWDRVYRSHMPVRSTCTRNARAFSQLLSNIRGSLSFSHTSRSENPARRSSWGAMVRPSPHRIRMPTRSICSGRISRYCRSRKAR